MSSAGFASSPSTAPPSQSSVVTHFNAELDDFINQLRREGSRLRQIADAAMGPRPEAVPSNKLSGGEGTGTTMSALNIMRETLNELRSQIDRFYPNS